MQLGLYDAFLGGGLQARVNISNELKINKLN